MSRVPAWVTEACRFWVLEQAHAAGEPIPSELELKVRVMRMTADQIREAREAV